MIDETWVSGRGADEGSAGRGRGEGPATLSWVMWGETTMITTMSAHRFVDYLRVRKGCMERAGLSEDLNLHDVVVTSTKPSLDTVTISHCVFQGFELVDRSYGGYATRASAPKVVIPLVFRRCTFTRSLALQDILFTRFVEFEECRFERFVDCSRSHFSGVCFRDCVFQEKVYFEDTCFSKSTATDRRVTDERIERNRAEADFSETTFLDGADFDGTVFFSPVTFAKARFYEATTFTNIRFRSYGNTDASSQPPARSSSVFSFTAAQVFGSVGFLKSANDLKTENTSPKGSSPPRIQACPCERLLGREVFTRLFEQVHKDHRGQSWKEPLAIDFTNVFVHSKYGLRFHSVNLEKCKLVGTNLDVCYFNNIRWPRVRSHVPVSALRRGGKGRRVVSGVVRAWGLPARLVRRLVWSLPVWSGKKDGEEKRRESNNRLMYGIYEHACLVAEMEEQLKSKDEESSAPWLDEQKAEKLAQLSKAYRDLKVAYEQDRDYIYASDFHYGEKELRRINPTVPWATKFQLNLFWVINGYGERALRPIALFLFLVLGGALAYDEEGLTRPLEEAYRISASSEGSSPLDERTAVRLFPGSQGARWYQCEKLAELCGWESVAYSAATTAFLRPDFLVLKEGVSPARVMSWFQTLAGPALFAMFALAIRNKLKR